MQRTNGVADARAIDDAGHVDLAGGDHLDVDVRVGERTKDLRVDAGRAPEPTPDDGHLGDAGGGGISLRVHDLCHRRQHAAGLGQVRLRDGEAQVRGAVVADVLEHDVDVDPRLTE